MGPALAFYFIYIGGMVYVGVRPAIESGNVLTGLLNGDSGICLLRDL